jgi:predicted DCC family thiol-disulfide oxidoreductase YuxK
VTPAPPKAEMIFYDGHCGLCDWAVKFVLKHDHSENAFRFAPLQGTTFKTLVPADRRARLPDSIVVLTREGTILAQSDAFVRILRGLGGFWGILAEFMAVVPRPVRDRSYNFVARTRYRIFGRRDDSCPVVPANLRARFDP